MVDLDPQGHLTSFLGIDRSDIHRPSTTSCAETRIPATRSSPNRCARACT
jgi:cellulose biosynthesis protein BcsQ